MIHTDAVVLGGGLYGCKIALALRSLGLKVLLLEPNKLLSGATTANQGRVHGGYHYPRSRTTALSAQKYYRRFLSDHAPAISANMRHLYAIAEGSKTSPDEFEKLCASVGAPLKSILIPNMFTPGMIQALYEVEEVTFDMDKLANFITSQLDVAGVDRRNVAGTIVSADEKEVIVDCGGTLVTTGYLFNCTYASIDKVVALRTALKKEHTEVALVRVYHEQLSNTDITVMDGPFWSLMKFPSHGCHALTHVKYTPHDEWYPYREEEPKRKRESLAVEMLRDAARFVPAFDNVEYLGSRHTTRVVLANNEVDDGRPILWEYSAQSPRIISVLGSKFNSIYDAIAKVEQGEWVRDRGATGVLTVGRRALVGYTGFVGSNIDAPGRFTDCANSTQPLAPDHYDLIVCAAPYAEKWRSNLDPETDVNQITDLMSMLSRCSADEFILISTIDAIAAKDSYGGNRHLFEEWVKGRFPNVRIIRLPALFGPGLKKNVLFDLMNAGTLAPSTVDVNWNSSYQWYPITRLWEDIKLIRREDNHEMNLVTPPIKMSWFAQFFPPKVFRLHDLVQYNVTDKRGWIMSEVEVKAALCEYMGVPCDQ